MQAKLRWAPDICPVVVFFFTILEVNTHESLDVCVVCSTITVRATLHLSLSVIAAVSDVKLWS